MKKLKLIYTLLAVLMIMVLVPCSLQAQYGPFKNYTAVGGNASVDNKAVDDNSNVSFSFPMIGLGKTAGTPALQTDGTYNITYTFTVKNFGQFALSNVQVYDTLTKTFPSPLTYTVKSIAATGTLKAATVATFTGVAGAAGLLNPATSTLAVGASATITLVVNVQVNGIYGAFNNTATANATTADNVPVFDVSHNNTNPDSDNDGNPFNNNTPTPVTFSRPDIAIAKSVNAATPYVGDTVTFTITATNVGKGAAVGITVNDLLPDGYTYYSHTASTGTYVASTGVWTIATLAANSVSPATLTVRAIVKDAGNYLNTASSNISTDTVTNNNESSIGTTPVKSADVQVVKEVSTAAPYEGDNVTFKFTATNNGPSTANNIVITDTLKNGFTVVTPLPTDVAYNSTTRILTWSVPTLINLATASVSFDVTVNPGYTAGDYVNRAVKTATEHDPKPSNDTSVVVVTPKTSADLVMKKSITAPSPLYAGDDVTFTLTVTNNGPSAATGVVVKDTLRKGYTYKSSTPSGFNIADSTWTIGTLASGASVSLDIVATVKADQDALEYGNLAAVTANEHDPDTDNNIDSIQWPTVLPLTDLVVKKTVDSTEARVEVSTVVFTVAAYNDGPSKATNVTVTDVLPDGYNFVSASPAAGYDKATGVWTIGNLAVYDTAKLYITATLKPVKEGLVYTNIATVTGSETDKNLDNNTDSVKVKPVSVVDLAIDKTYSVPNPFYPGDDIKFTLTVTNNGPSDATNVIITDSIRAGYTYKSSSPAGYNPADGTWSIGNLASGATTSVEIVAVAKADSSVYAYGNLATVTSDEFDKDLSNNTDSIVAPTVTPLTDLQMVKTVDKPTADVGTNVEFTLTVTNNGPSAATLVKVDEQLPNGYTFVSAAPAAQYNATTHTWTIGNLAYQASATLKITATVNADKAGINYNNVAVVSGNETDTSLNNNIDSAKISQVPVIDLAINKTYSAGSPLYAGNDIIFHLAVVNNGPSDATNVKVTETLQKGYTFKSASSTGYDATTGIWTIGSLANGATVTLDITATVNAGQLAADYGNTATVTGDEQDSNTGNNTSTITTPTVTPLADLAVEKTADKATVNIDAPVNFTIVVTNNGPSNATGVTVTDVLPSGYKFVSATPAGAYNSTNGLWTIGNLANGATATLTVATTLNATGNYLNTAVVTGNEADTVLTNNTSTASSAVNPNPIAVDDDTTTEEPTPVIIPVLNNDHAQSGTLNVSTVVIKTQPAHGTVTVNADGTVTYTPNDGYEGDDSFTYTVKDSNGNESNVATVTITVTKRKVDLAIVKRIITDKADIAVGREVSFELLVTNKSTKKASDVEVIDILAANLGGNDVRLSTSTGSAVYDNTTKRITWTIGSMEGGATATLVITAKVISGGDVENTAVVSGSDEDPDLTNNTSSVSTNSSPEDLFIPNVITPNGDGKNDKFVILGLTSYPGSPIMIYNRWGNMVYQSSDYKNDWTGKGLNDGTYYYILTVNKPSGKRVYKGWIQKLN
ncbi:conserved repeat domain-containing protein/gliding motility-associated C-terminal domain-containing protein [Filimonas lacunae]|uniref:Conserved repeat domain-containing protein/gliding motility-associated C-terminal domain-containing protein n=1 Tax=Filimonas lacunae TaxID=477680 RepID=A0A173MM14_9BACT|nr:gliding motility-associated C-terminal domain-containing protein [Filimonas lacunae]BAV08693.1 internalin [Filimonas lacunae]SIS60076.1 conserved repeat domain-containing protein/gliding motility-associated C-terminal domain-containing protein [Filimonas lacunae]